MQGGCTRKQIDPKKKKDMRRLMNFKSCHRVEKVQTLTSHLPRDSFLTPFWSSRNRAVTEIALISEALKRIKLLRVSQRTKTRWNFSNMSDWSCTIVTTVGGFQWIANGAVQCTAAVMALSSIARLKHYKQNQNAKNKRVANIYCLHAFGQL